MDKMYYVAIYVRTKYGESIKVFEPMYVHVCKSKKQLVVGYAKDFSKSRAEGIVNKFGIKLNDPRIEVKDNHIYYNFKKK